MAGVRARARVQVQGVLFVLVLMMMPLTHCSADWPKASQPRRLPLRTSTVVVVVTVANPL